jgi:hypothetical protein
VLNDTDPYTGGTNQNTSLHLSNLLTQAGKTWKSYQEDIDLTPNGAGQLTNIALPRFDWTGSTIEFLGCVRRRNRESVQWRQLSTTTQPSTIPCCSSAIPTVATMRLLQIHCAQTMRRWKQLLVDLANDTVADYNWITPNQFSDMHTTLSAGYKGLTGDAPKISQGDDFLRQSFQSSWRRMPIRTTESSSFGLTNPNQTASRATIRTTSTIPVGKSSSLRALTRRPSLRQLVELHACFRSAHLAEYLSRGAVSR